MAVSNLEFSMDDVRAALSYLDESDMDLWVRMGMAIKGEFGESGFDIWDNWGQGYSKYKAKEAQSRWKSFKIAGARGTVTIGSLFHLALEKGFTFSQPDLSAEQKAEFAKQREIRQREREADIEREEKETLRWQSVIAQVAGDLVQHLKPTGTSAYLGKKKVGAYGIYFAPHSFVIRTNENFTVDVFKGAAEVKEFFANKTNEDSFVFFKKGTILVPLYDLSNVIQNLQIIFTDGQSKRFLKEGRKSGCFHVLGKIDNQPIIFCEGYATGASLHKATDLPVVVCFDAGNLPVVAQQFHDWPNKKIIAGDNDWETALDPAKKNTGVIKAQEAAIACGGTWCVPEFSVDAKGLSDFNDLHIAEGLKVIKSNIETAIAKPKPNFIFATGDKNAIRPDLEDRRYASIFSPDTPPDFGEIPLHDESDVPANIESQSESPSPSEPEKPTIELLLQRYCWAMPDGKIWDSLRKKIIKKIPFQISIGKELFKEWVEHENRREVNLEDVQNEISKAQISGSGGLAQAIRRYVYLNPSSTAWDNLTRQMVSLGDLRYAIADCFDQWLKHPERRDLPKENLVFDPTQQVDPKTHINMFRGLPITPTRNDDNCRNIRHMLWCLCNKENQIFEWICKWLAYPLQHVGAKMQSSVLMHSDVHGSGKSYFFDGVMRVIYGDYCRTFGQAELESQYNDWISQTLFGVFEEVLSRSQRYSHTGTLKQMITGTKVRVNQKYMQGWEESNHMNCVFLSNEVQPLPVEPSDRRFLVIWPESKLLDELKTGVDAELKKGGAAAFYDWLLRVDTTGFNAYSEPPPTEAKQRLIDIGRPAWEVFHDDWLNGRLDVPYCSCLVRDLFRVYVRWCNQRHENMVSMNRFSGYISSKERKRPDLHYEYGSLQGKGSFFLIGKCPNGKTQSEWLAGCVGEFDRVTKKYDQEAQ